MLGFSNHIAEHEREHVNRNIGSHLAATAEREIHGTPRLMGIYNSNPEGAVTTSHAVAAYNASRDMPQPRGEMLMSQNGLGQSPLVSSGNAAILGHAKFSA